MRISFLIDNDEGEKQKEESSRNNEDYNKSSFILQIQNNLFFGNTESLYLSVEFHIRSL